MKKRKALRTFPEPTEAEIQAAFPKSETVQLRLSKTDKADIAACADKIGLTRSEYLLRCHSFIARRIHDIS